MLQELFNLNEQLDAKDFIDIVIELKNFQEIEYDIDTNVSEVFNEFDRNLKIPLAYTTIDEDEDFEIQVYLDLQFLRVIKKVTNHYQNIKYTHYEYENLKNKEEVLEYINCVSFSEMTTIKADVKDLQKIVS